MDSAAAVGETLEVDGRDLAERAGKYIDARHPKVVRAVLGVRWGGLRTVELDPVGWSALLGAGATAGAATRSVVRATRRASGSPRPPSVGGFLGSLALGALLGWLVFWRWDTARWHRRYVSLTVDLSASDLDELAARLQEVAPVETWEDPFGPGGARRGLLVPVRDVRAVNAALGTAAGALSYR